MSGPQYLSRGGEQVFVPSYVAEGVQFFGFVVKADSAPSERYVRSLADSAKYRLPANGSGFENLVITGDWIQNGYNAGCVEAAVWSGIQAANTILGRPLNEGVMTR